MKLQWKRSADPVTGRVRMMACAGRVAFGVYEGSGDLHVFPKPGVPKLIVYGASESEARGYAQWMVDEIVAWASKNDGQDARAPEEVNHE